jgi:hypothetical protein
MPLPDAVGSHVPILIGLAGLLKPRTVCEFGIGLHSTPLFLSDVFNLDRLLSFENNAEWSQALLNAHGNDPRFHLVTVNGAIASAAAEVHEVFDLTFIDDSMSAAERAETIATVAHRRSVVAVIHDFEEAAYRHAALYFEHAFTFDIWNPMTGVCWNGGVSLRKDLREVRDRVRVHANIPVTDVAAWRSALNMAALPW